MVTGTVWPPPYVAIGAHTNFVFDGSTGKHCQWQVEQNLMRRRDTLKVHDDDDDDDDDVLLVYLYVIELNG